MDISLAGWDMHAFDDIAWSPWGSDGRARAKVLGSADGYFISLIEAEAGYRGDPHAHDHAEFFYLIEGTLRNQGCQLSAGAGYAAAAGSTHADFEVGEGGARYISIFRL
jgi:quercetin dioxygenase-like cupin family protein